ncbi:Hypothetical protein, putative [Bodo saltans]|uniref:Uncharacterized protein n=1 Tax=Bodo saltans TaxID=75058 RepID=A0A0S4KNS5_BODSA|nr:Hypothetical protein, putative [Bodo saltans]|eukprot:CUM57959.1 Hypothetical protein, putative [Bodo saltans]
MDPVRGAYYLLKAHLLHYDAPRQTAKAAARQPAGGPAAGTATAPSAQGGNPGGMPPGDSKQRLFGGRGAQGVSEVARFISEHIHAIRNADPSVFGTTTFSTSARSANRTTASRVGGSDARELNTTRRDKLTHDLEYALFCLHKSHERFPSPRLSLLELTRAMATHMMFHKNNQGVVSGEYIMKALMLFFGVDKQEALSRYIGPLVNCGCLRPTAASKGVRTVNDVEKSGFYVQVPAELRNIHQLFDFRESASRLVCIYCTRAVEDGANELIYLSHSRWLFGEPPSAEVAASKPIDDPCGMFPEQFRRGFVGPLFQFISSFCLSECHMFETLHDQCAIIRLNGVKMVVAQLFPCNIPALVLDPESGKKARCDTPVVLMMGLPERIPNNVIHMGVKKMLDAVEMSIGPRSMFGTDLPSDVFRDEVRRLGSKIFSLSTHMFFSMESPDCTFEPASHAQEENRRELGGLLDNGVMDQVFNATRTKRPNNGFPTRVPFALNHRSSTHPLSRKSCSSATQILLSLRDTCAAYGGCVCSAMFYHGALVMSDTHPYVTALLGLFARLSLYKAQPVPQPLSAEGDVTQATIMAHLLSRCGAMSSECSTGFPVRDQLPTGVYADSHFGEPASRSGAHASPQGSPGPGRSDPPTPASPNGASPRQSEAPSSPTHADGPAYSAARSPSSTTNDEESSLLPSHLTEQTLYPGYCFLSEELVALLPKPARCPRNQRPDSDKYDCHDPLNPSVPIETMEPGFYHTVHLSASGVDIVLVLPEVYSAPSSSSGAPSSPSPHASGSFPSPSSSVQESIRSTFQEELSSLGREISSLSTQLSRSDTIPREVDMNTDSNNGGDNEGGGGHVDPAAGTGRDNHGGGSSPSNHGAPGGSGATTMQTVQSALASPLCAVHDLALGVTEFVDGSLGSQEEIAHHQRVVPSALMLNRATVFLKEANALSQLLGTSFRQPLRHPDEDNGSMDPPFAIEPTTRVILGRSAFAERDRRGPHAVIYARQSGGQQVFFGAPTAGAGSAASQYPATLRHVEEQYVQFVSSSRSHTVVI